MHRERLHELLTLVIGVLTVSMVACTGPAQILENPPVGRPIVTVNSNTPIKHVVVIFQENVSFDHYFATYPRAKNPANEPAFIADPQTPSVSGLSRNLLLHNHNQANPQRLDRTQAITCDQDHSYTAEQRSFHQGQMDQFVQFVSGNGCKDKSIVMDYYDGNTVTGLWNYAQHFAMSDHFFGTTFGPSTVGAINLISGQTHGASPTDIPALVTNATIIGDVHPAYDDCSKGTSVMMSGTNIGDLLNAKNITWGWFQGGFRPSSMHGYTATCTNEHRNIGGILVSDYVAHHEPFQYYQSTANPHHLPPSAPDMIGRTDQAHHQYDLTDFWTATALNNLPAVSFLKAAAYQDGHAAYSDPLDEQVFLINTINHLQQLPTWKDTAIIIAYDDSDGWYDHVQGPLVNESNDPQNDALDGDGLCGNGRPAGGYLDRCGYGPRLPLLIISPFARQNFVDHTTTDQSSILRFIEENWNLGPIGNYSFDAVAGTFDKMFDFTRPSGGALFLLNPSTGRPDSQ